MAPQSATILPFGLTARQGQTFLALVVAAAFFYETAGVGRHGRGRRDCRRPRAAAPTPPPPPRRRRPRRRSASWPSRARRCSRRRARAPRAGVVAASRRRHGRRRPRPSRRRASAARARAPRRRTGRPVRPCWPPRRPRPPAGHPGHGRRRPAGRHRARTSTSSAAPATTPCAAAAAHDLLEGGAGDDRIELAAGVTAVGGAGADTFVIQAPATLGRPDTLLGVILDFSGWRGRPADRLARRDGPARPAPPAPPAGRRDRAAAPSGGGDLTGAVTSPRRHDPGADLGRRLRPDPGRPAADPRRRGPRRRRRDRRLCAGRRHAPAPCAAADERQPVIGVTGQSARRRRPVRLTPRGARAPSRSPRPSSWRRRTASWCCRGRRARSRRRRSPTPMPRFTNSTVRGLLHVQDRHAVDRRWSGRSWRPGW